MSPAIPAGSLAVVRQIPAQDAHVGDVVTVSRPGDLPITHRVVSTRPGTNGTTMLRLKGDANAAPDPTAYVVSTVRLVIWHAPRLAYVVVWLGGPVVPGALAVAVSALVVWVLWPRDGEEEGEGRRSKHRLRRAI
jgi:signal peptidase